MKTNKFRVWDGKKFLAADSFCLFPEDDGTFTPRKLGAYGSLEDVPNAVIQQYTGLKDCNGKEIYDGDIIQIDDKDETRIYKVVFEDSYFGIYRGDKIKHALLYPYNNACKVIGNIFENPELLK